MIESVTKSFCERCGTRYDLEVPLVEKKRRGLGLNVLRGARAVSETEPAVTALDQFLTVFRFCLGCRQYTCPPCWNDKAGSCASCTPFPDAPPARPPQVGGVEAAESERLTERARLGPDTWPAADIAEVMTANAQVMESAAQPPHEERPDLAEAPPIPGSESDAALAAAWNQLLLGATPVGSDQLYAEPLEEWATLFDEPRLSPVQPEPEAEPMGAVEPEPMGAVEPEREPEPMVAVEPEPTARPAPTSLPAHTALPAPWSITAPDGDPPTPTVWPPMAPVYRASPPSPPAAAQAQRPIASLLARTLGGSRGIAAGVPATTSSVRPCGSCGLPLSAQARFCR